MTDWSPGPLHFSTLRCKGVVADFDGGRSTTDSGALLLRDVADPRRLFDALSPTIPDSGQPRYTVHDQKAIVS